jgi:hypothetical protein
MAVAATLAAAVTALVIAAGAVALVRSVPAPPASPTSADQIQNIDQVKTAIKGYYGDTPTSQVDPVPNAVDGGDKTLHQYAPDSAYAAEVAGVVQDAEKYLAKAPQGKDKKDPGAKAILFDIDDTTLNTYSYEIYSSFVYTPSTNAYFVNACLTTGCVFPAVPGMVALEQYAEGLGYTVFFLTGRPASQHDGTVANLTEVGYDVTDANLYLKDQSKSWLSSCAPSCTTVQYKSLTRQYIESQGYNIVANFGDQFSDLLGGFADQTFKIPNPTYFIA